MNQPGHQLDVTVLMVTMETHVVCKQHILKVIINPTVPSNLHPTCYVPCLKCILIEFKQCEEFNSCGCNVTNQDCNFEIKVS